MRWRASNHGRSRREELLNGRGEMGVLGGFLRDARYGMRTMRRHPSFALAVVLIFGTGIAATTTIFSVVDTVILRPLPYPDADRLVHFDNGNHSYPVFRAWSDLSAFDALGAMRYHEVVLTGQGEPRKVTAQAVSSQFFEMFGARAALGRLVTDEDFPGDRSEVVLSHGFWVRIGADPHILGRSLRLDGAPSTVVGVLERDFAPPFGGATDLWFALDGGGEYADFHGFRDLRVAGRLASGMSLEGAQEQVDTQRRALAEVEPGIYVDGAGSLVTTPLVPIHEATVRGVSSTLFMLLGAVGMLLMIACANVANLLTARGTDRAHELALRRAMGAGRPQIAFQVLTESVVLSLAGGALGVLLAYGAVELFGHHLPADLPRLDALAVDLRVLGFSFGLCVLTGLGFGLLPTVQAMRQDVSHRLKDGALASTTGGDGRRVRGALLTAEIALAVVLVIGAGLFSRTLVAMVRVDPGFDAEGLVVIPLRVPEGTEAPNELTHRLLDEMSRVAGVSSAALAWETPLTSTGGARLGMSTVLVGDPALYDEGDPVRTYLHPVTADYLHTLGVQVIRGRDFEEGDELLDPIPTVLTEGAAELLFGSADPLGQIVRPRTNRTYRVIGVAKAVHHWGLDQELDAGIYVPYQAEGMFGNFQALVRGAGQEIESGLRDAIWHVDPDMPVDGMVTMERRISNSVASPRFLAVLLGGFAIVALVLASGGVYASMLYTVSQRRRELGIRLAVGATGGDLARLVLGYGIALAGLGIALGTAAALYLSRLVEGLVWGVEPTDPVAFSAAAAILMLAAVGASVVPLRKALGTDPVQTLRTDR
jgi:putative ABC transport system permease protein